MNKDRLLFKRKLRKVPKIIRPLLYTSYFNGDTITSGSIIKKRHVRQSNKNSAFASRFRLVPPHPLDSSLSTKDMIMMKTRLERISTTSTRWKQNTFFDLITKIFIFFFTFPCQTFEKEKKKRSRQQCYDTLFGRLCDTHQLRDWCSISLHCNFTSPTVYFPSWNTLNFTKGLTFRVCIQLPSLVPLWFITVVGFSF